MKLFSVYLISFFAILGGKSFASELPTGGAAFGLVSLDGWVEHGHSHDIEVSGSGFSFYYFLDDRLEVAFSRMTGDSKYENYFLNGDLKYDVEESVMGVFFHRSRTNLLTGEGKGFSFGIRSIKSDFTNGEDDAFFYSNTSHDSEEFVVRTSNGLGDGLSWGTSLTSTIDKFLDDYSAGLHLTNAIDDQFTISFYYTFARVAEDNETDEGYSHKLGASIGFHF